MTKNITNELQADETQFSDSNDSLAIQVKWNLCEVLTWKHDSHEHCKVSNASKGNVVTRLLLHADQLLSCSQ